MDLIVLGVDGVAPKLLEEAVEKYDLEGWKELKQNSVFSELPSTMPAVTVPAWMTMFSGYDPGRIGSYHLATADFEDWSLSLNRSFDRINFWDKLDRTVSLHNVPGTTPVYQVNGYMRGGFPHITGTFDFYPQSLENDFDDLELEKQNSYAMNTAKASVEAEFENFRLEEKVMNGMMEKNVDVFVSVIKMTDDVGHYANKKDQILKAYREADRAVKTVLEKAEKEDANLLVVSDHGFKKYDTHFNVTTFLEGEGLLEKVEGSEESKIYDVFEPLLKTRLKKYLRNLHNYYSSFTGKRLDGKDGNLFETIEKSSKVVPMHKGLGRDCLLKVHTEELPHGHVEKEEKQEIIEQLKESLLEVEYRGENVVEEVFEGEKIYSGDGFKPDVAFRTKKEFAVETKTMRKMFNSTKSFSHDVNGIFYAKGPDVNHEADVEVDIYDVAPIIYTLLGEKIPGNLRGKVPEKLLPELKSETKSSEIEDISI